MRVSVGDLELYVHEKGEGRPLIALHGGPGLDGSVGRRRREPHRRSRSPVAEVVLRNEPDAFLKAVRSFLTTV